jgi:hypothetical protein
VLPWLILAMVVVPLLVVAFAATKRSTRSGEAATNADPEVARRTEQEFADAERYEEEWRAQRGDPPRQRGR